MAMRMSPVAFAWAIPSDWPDREVLATATFDEIYLAEPCEVGYSAYNTDHLWELLADCEHGHTRDGIATGRADYSGADDDPAGLDGVWASARRIIGECRDPMDTEYETEQVAVIPVRALPFVVEGENQ